MSWTDERVALLKKLWGEGKTAAEIAKELGGVTRNAVIGKAHRLKLSNRVSPIQQNNKKPVARTVAANDKGSATVAAAAIPTARIRVANNDEKIQVKGLKLADLKDRMCRWPLGDPRDSDFSFCGCASVPGLPYCTEHAKIAYQAASRNRVLKAEDFEDANATESEEENKEAVA